MLDDATLLTVGTEPKCFTTGSKLYIIPDNSVSLSLGSGDSIVFKEVLN